MYPDKQIPRNSDSRLPTWKIKSHQGTLENPQILENNTTFQGINKYENASIKCKFVTQTASGKKEKESILKEVR
jgi:hypothetical protein